MEIEGYRLNHPERLDTPSFLVFEDLVHHNIREILRVCGIPDRVVPHAKTHKSAAVLRLQMEAGFSSFKVATMREAELLADNGVKEIIVSYPVMHPEKISRFVGLSQRYPDLSLRAIVSRPEHLPVLAEAAGAIGSDVDIYIDLDTGMHRTGVQPGEEAGSFYAQAARSPGLNVLGVHVFDGHMLYKPELAEREPLMEKSLEYIHDTWDRARAHGLDVIDNIAGGSWSFHLFLRDENIRVSPGTWVYWDSQNARQSELDFEVAAVVLGQVIDRNDAQGTVTLDIGSKAITPDLPTERRFTLVGHPRAELVAQSEEHGVVMLNGESLGVGDMVLAAPGHACTTTVKYPRALVVNSEGDIVGTYDHEARDR